MPTNVVDVVLGTSVNVRPLSRLGYRGLTFTTEDGASYTFTTPYVLRRAVDENFKIELETQTQDITDEAGNVLDTINVRSAKILRIPAGNCWRRFGHGLDGVTSVVAGRIMQGHRNIEDDDVRQMYAGLRSAGTIVEPTPPEHSNCRSDIPVGDHVDFPF